MLKTKRLLAKLIEGQSRQNVRRKCGQTASATKYGMDAESGPSNMLRKRYFGQPTHDTHPHLIPTGNVMPMITTRELQARRQKLIDLIAPDRSNIIVIPSASKKFMSDKIPYVFRQNTDFLYFSGCQEPDSCLVIETKGGSQQPRSTLFMRERDLHSEVWDGPRTGPENAVQLFGVDEALPIKHLSTFLKSKLKDVPTLWYDMSNPIQENIHTIMKEFVADAKNWHSPRTCMHQLRLFKSPAEIELIKRSCDIASKAILRCMKASQPGISEHELLARMEYHCKVNGAQYLAYPPVIAGGDRATIIHYINNDQIIHDHDMVLMDAGCEFHGYTSDITRTWPVNKSFTKEQRELYEIVLHVQSHLIDSLKKRPTLDQLFDLMCMKLGQALQELGIFKNKSNSIEVNVRKAFDFCPHHVSHYLGMDVHDTNSILRNVPVQPGMVITIEPGVYINHKMRVPDRYKGIGIRIEDDILITDSSHVVLSAKCPKSISDIENVMSYDR